MTLNRLLFIALVVAVVALFPPVAEPQRWHGTFTASFFGILLASIPYIIIGSFIGGLIEVFMPAQVLPRLVARLGWWGIPGAVALAPVIPVCECGVLGVARGLMRKGLPLPHTVAYLLAGPILNPTVLFTTWLAFRDQGAVVPAYRALGAVVVSVAVGALIARFNPRRMLLPAIVEALPAAAVPRLGMAMGGWARSGAPASAAAPSLAQTGLSAVRSRDGVVFAAPRGVLATMAQLSHHVLGHFLDMAAFFLMGVAIAAGMAAWVAERNIDLASLGNGTVSGPATMMVTAFVLSLCAEADAFVARSFTGFALPALIAFLVFGPMFDIKLLLMYRVVFRAWAIALLAGAIAVLTFAYVLVIGLFL